MNKEYKDMLSELHFSEEQKENMVDRLMHAQLEPVQPAKSAAVRSDARLPQSQRLRL